MAKAEGNSEGEMLYLTPYIPGESYYVQYIIIMNVYD